MSGEPMKEAEISFETTVSGAVRVFETEFRSLQKQAGLASLAQVEARLGFVQAMKKRVSDILSMSYTWTEEARQMENEKSKNEHLIRSYSLALFAFLGMRLRLNEHRYGQDFIASMSGRGFDSVMVDSSALSGGDGLGGSCWYELEITRDRDGQNTIEAIQLRDIPDEDLASEPVRVGRLEVLTNDRGEVSAVSQMTGVLAENHGKNFARLLSDAVCQESRRMNDRLDGLHERG